MVDGRRVYTHERLRRARSSLSSPVSAGTLFTYLDPALAKAGPLPSTNNMIEGGVNSQLRAVGHPGDLLDNTFNIELRSTNPSKTDSKQQLLPQIAFRHLPQLDALGTSPEHDNRHHHVERYLRYCGGN